LQDHRGPQRPKELIRKTKVEALKSVEGNGQ